jgi:dipeptide transport system ATP-binding protein
MSLLDVHNLTVEFGRTEQPFRAVDALSFSIEPGEILGIVGESGSGKSVTQLALMGLIEAPGRVRADRLDFDGKNLLTLPASEKRKILGRDIAMVFQDALTSLNPAFTVGFQLEETLRIHAGLRGSAAKARALELLEQVEIPAAKSRLQAFPHQLSGGMCQRVMIAIAIACNPKLLIADEPTTALDVTVQAQIMDLLLNLQKQRGMALILITHDLAVVAEVAHRVAVMYAGQLVEGNRVPEVFEKPHHPYTEALLASIPEHSKGASRLNTLSGVVPGQYDRPAGCLLAPRCPYVADRCRVEQPGVDLVGPAQVRCFYPRDLASSSTLLHPESAA